MKIEKELNWIVTRESPYSLLGNLVLILRESYKSEKIILKANRANWDWLEIISKFLGLYGWQRNELVTEKITKYSCPKCRKASNIRKCNNCGVDGNGYSITNGVYILEPVGALMAYRQEVLKDGHTLEIVDIVEKSKELQSLMDKQIPKKDFIDLRGMKE